MAFDLDESELIATRVNNKTASWKEVEEYIEKYYVKKDKIKKEIKGLENIKYYKPLDNRYTYKELIEFGIEELQELLQDKENNQ